MDFGEQSSSAPGIIQTPRHTVDVQDPEAGYF